MKKCLLIAAVAMIALSSCCGDKCKTGAGADSTMVDSATVDSSKIATKGDSIIEDEPNGVATPETDSTIPPAPER